MDDSESEMGYVEELNTHGSSAGSETRRERCNDDDDEENGSNPGGKRERKREIAGEEKEREMYAHERKEDIREGPRTPAICHGDLT